VAGNNMGVTSAVTASRRRYSPDGCNGRDQLNATEAAKIEGGQVYLAQNAPRLEDLRTELLAFPNDRHDDQVDSISQALKFMSNRLRVYAVAA
jgi:phage terminase large subunit-like protein